MVSSRHVIVDETKDKDDSYDEQETYSVARARPRKGPGESVLPGPFCRNGSDKGGDSKGLNLHNVCSSFVLLVAWLFGSFV